VNVRLRPRHALLALSNWRDSLKEPPELNPIVLAMQKFNNVGAKIRLVVATNAEIYAFYSGRTGRYVYSFSTRHRVGLR
jgi:hypothetical protein